ncbi:hypothetical protein BVRB_6g154330 [Beta vulgaris subsp. vulgaris]|nr:hypothetical protein BVRB_6g154330 [Beta vulgaris subsp. vulgaris]
MRLAKVWVSSQQGLKSAKDVTSLLVDFVEFHEVVSLQGPCDLAYSEHRGSTSSSVTVSP